MKGTKELKEATENLDKSTESAERWVLQQAKDAAMVAAAYAYLVSNRPLAKLCEEMLTTIQNPANKDYTMGSDAMRFVAEQWRTRFEEIVYETKKINNNRKGEVSHDA